jgi:hypothetical protein
MLGKVSEILENVLSGNLGGKALAFRGG